MIDLERFGSHRDLADRALRRVEEHLEERLEADVELELAPSVDGETLERIEELEWDLYEEDIAYEIDDFREFLDRPDALVVLLRIDGELAGYAFGYPEDPDAPIVKGADFFMDDGVVDRVWERRGIGTIVAAALYLLVHLLGYRRIGLTTEERDSEGRELVAWYHRLGFEDAETDVSDDVAMVFPLDPEHVAGLVAAIPGLEVDQLGLAEKPRA